MSKPIKSQRGSDIQTVEAFLTTKFPPKEPLVIGLINRRDLVAFGARRRHGKTTTIIQLALDLATGEPSFLGYEIPEPRRSLLFLLEDDPRELQEKITAQLGDREPENRVAIYARDDFHRAGIPIDGGQQRFQGFLKDKVSEHRPDLIVLDNLAHIVGADYANSERLHKLGRFLYELARDADAAIIVPAHPRKNSDNHPVTLDDGDGTAFFESIMGSSHFINSMGSLWGLERSDERTVFLGGRQRADGHQQRAYLELGDDGRFTLLSSVEAHRPLVLNTEIRRQAWKLLPDTFGFNDGYRRVKTVMRSRGAYAAWLAECRRLSVIQESGGRLRKADSAGLRLVAESA